MTDRNESWVVLATYGAGWEADFAAETLREAGIPAQVEAGQNAGLFGLGYQGLTQFGVKLRVPWHREDEARDVLGLDDDEEGDPVDGDDDAGGTA